MKVGLGVGLGVGIPLVLIAGVFVGIKAVKQRRGPSPSGAALYGGQGKYDGWDSSHWAIPNGAGYGAPDSKLPTYHEMPSNGRRDTVFEIPAQRRVEPAELD